MDPNIICGPPVPSFLLSEIHIPLYKYFIKSMAGNASHVVMIDGLTGKKLTTGDIISQSIILAEELQALGSQPGVVIGILCGNRLDYPIILTAVLRTGATFACFNPGYSLGELEHTVDITQPYIMFVDSSSIAKLKQIKIKMKNLKYIINLDEDIEPSVINYNVLLTREKKLKWTEPEIDENYTALILFSSGSTGLPKGVMLSSRSLVFVFTLTSFMRQMAGEVENISLSVIPMFHGYGVLMLLRSILGDGKLITLQKFQNEIFLSTIEKYKVTNLALVPALMVFLAKHPIVQNYNLSSLRSVSCGAAPLSPKIEEEVLQKFGLDKIIKGYGMTETTIITTVSLIASKIGAVGKVIPGMIAKVIDLETGETLGSYKEGEICFKGILLMKGYYRNKAETDSTIDEDGWLHTGDIGYYDDEEDFFIVDRIKDLIKYKGFQVAPAELEALLLKHEAIKDAAVVGFPDEIAGEVPRAFVVKMKDVTEQEIINYIAGQVASHMKLRGGVKFVQEIPRNANGKILRRVLRNIFQSKL